MLLYVPRWQYAFTNVLVGGLRRWPQEWLGLLRVLYDGDTADGFHPGIPFALSSCFDPNYFSLISADKDLLVL